jgi:hypothetical protein
MDMYGIVIIGFFVIILIAIYIYLWMVISDDDVDILLPPNENEFINLLDKIDPIEDDKEE